MLSGNCIAKTHSVTDLGRHGSPRFVPKTYVCWQGFCAFSGALFLRLTGHFSGLCRGVFGQVRYGLNDSFAAAMAASISFCRQSSRHAYDNRSVTSRFPPICLTRGMKSRLLNSASRKATSKPCFHRWVSSLCQSASRLGTIFIRCRDSITIPAKPPTGGQAGAVSRSMLA